MKTTGNDLIQALQAQQAAKREKKTKDNIYIPQQTIDQANDLAKELGVSKNVIIERAIQAYYDRMPELIQAQIDEKQARINGWKKAEEK